MEGLRADVARLPRRVVRARLDRDRDGLLNFGRALYKDGDFSELKEVLRALLSVQDVQGLHGLQLRWLYANALREAENATLDDLVEAVETLDDVSQKWRRMLGPQHPDYPAVENALNRTREALAQARASK